jgi:tRNA dimethylallyltransferase
VAEYLSGRRSLDQTIDLVKIRTRQFAKRQLTWFKKHGHWTSLKIESEHSQQSTERILATLSKSSL